MVGCWGLLEARPSGACLQRLKGCMRDLGMGIADPAAPSVLSPAAPPRRRAAAPASARAPRCSATASILIPSMRPGTWRRPWPSPAPRWRRRRWTASSGRWAARTAAAPLPRVRRGRGEDCPWPVGARHACGFQHINHRLPAHQSNIPPSPCPPALPQLNISSPALGAGWRWVRRCSSHASTWAWPPRQVRPGPGLRPHALTAHPSLRAATMTGRAALLPSLTSSC